MILQQTQLSRGLEYYKEFVKRFPDVRALASARWPSVLKVWRGLGYYNRAKNMQRAAKILRDDYQGKFPKSYAELVALPGVGPYTANAILSFAYGKNIPAIDTNLNRVIQRLYGCPAVQVGKRAQALFDGKPRSSKTLNYALMDLGATVCTSKNPKCDQCPLAWHCDFKKSNRKSVKTTSTRKRRNGDLPVVDVAIGCIHQNGEYLLAKRKRSKGGNWEFPGGKREGREGIRAALKREVKEELGVEVSVRPPFMVTEFKDGAYQWRLHFCRCQILSGRARAKEHDKIKWVSAPELGKYKMPKMNDDAVQRLQSFR